jgi:primase-polymerase (primpol)-like protein
MLPSLEIDAIRELSERDQWVCWRYEARGGEPTKVPYAPTWQPASSTNASTWSTFERCFAAAVRERFDGIGYVFSESDPYVGIDLDDALRPDGTLEPWADEIVRELDTYAEVSPSGAGLKLFCRGSLPPGRRRTGKLEMYDAARYFTVTGRLWGERETIEERTEALAQLHARTFGDQAKLEGIAYNARPFDGTLPRRMEFLLFDQRIRRRFERSTEGLEDTSPSAIDFSLASILAHRGCTGAEVEAVVRISRARDATARPKRDSYFRLTTERALSAARFEQ